MAWNVTDRVHNESYDRKIVMSFQDAVNAASVFPDIQITTPKGKYSLPVVMVAIAGHESSFNTDSKGDYGYSGPNCDGSTSWGLWQIHNSHSQYLTKATGSSNPCDWEKWCFNPTNNAKAALAIIQGASSAQNGVENAWYNTWHSGAYLQYLDKAQAAMSSNSQASNPVVYQNVSSVSTPEQSTTEQYISGQLSNINIGKYEEYGVITLVVIIGILAIREAVASIRSL